MSVPAKYQFRVLFWGIFGALALRGVFIFAGVALLERFGWVLYLFGVVLLFGAYRIMRHDETEIHPEHTRTVVAPLSASWWGVGSEALIGLGR